MKKKFKKTIILLMIAILTFSFANIQASTTYDNWISESLSDYEPLQTLIKKHPEAKMVENSTKYILTEITKDKEGNVLEANEKVFTNISSMQKYENQLKKENNIVPYTIGDQETKYKTYAKMKVGLSMYKYSSSRFFVAFVYDWLTVPEYDLLTYYKAVVGLALDSGLSMDSSSYGGRVTLTNINGDTIMRNSLNGGVDIKATGTQGIGYKIKESHQWNGAIVDMEGVISCEANKNQPTDNFCSAYGEYAHVSTTLNLDNFSVSLDGGISFGLTTTKTPYSFQDSLYIR